MDLKNHCDRDIFEHSFRIIRTQRSKLFIETPIDWSTASAISGNALKLYRVRNVELKGLILKGGGSDYHGTMPKHGLNLRKG